MSREGEFVLASWNQLDVDNYCGETELASPLTPVDLAGREGMPLAAVDSTKN